MKWNEAQSQAIETREKNILVSAAAGSGKTAVLVERIKTLIIEEETDIEEMLIVTFTNAAAAEMRERIYSAISEKVEEGGSREQFLRIQLGKIGSANISTFHAFCMEVIRRYFYLTDISSDFKICDEIQKNILQNSAMDQLMEEAFSWDLEEEENRPFLRFAQKFSAVGNERNLRSMVDETYKFIQSLPRPFEWLEQQTEALQKSEEERTRKTSEDGQILLRLVRRYDEIFRELKSRKNLLDFNDIEHIALEILDREEPQNEYRTRFRHIFVDEYQDSNVVQEALIDKIKRPDNVFLVGDVKQSIYKFRLAEPELFIKKYERYKNGEEADSIKIDLNRNYRSKKNVIGCVNRVFSEMMTVDSGGIDYDEDAMLYQGMGDERDIDYPAELHLIDERQIEVGMLDSTIEEMRKAELEGAICSKIIRDSIGKEYFDWKKGEVRKTEYRDIVILFRAFKTNAEIFQEMLQKEGIPVYADGGDGYFDTTEITVFSNLLKVIDNKRQDIPLLSVMRSPVGGFTLEEIAEIRAFQREGLFAEAFLQYERKGPEGALKEKVDWLLTRLGNWQEKSRQMTLEQFLWHLADDTLYYEYIGALPAGEQRKANLRLLIEKGRQYQQSTTQGLFGFLHYLEQMKKTKTPVGQMKMLGEGENVVRIMSIHKSKGLEFPTVIVGGIGKKFNRSRSSSDLSFDRKIGLGIRYHDSELGYYIKTPIQREIDEAKKKEETAEEMRILYVALTRARDRLILLGTAKGTLDEILEKSKESQPEEAKSYLDWLLGPLHRLSQESPDQMEIYTYDRIDIANRWKQEEDRESETGENLRDGFAIESEEGRRIQEAVYRRMDFSYPYSAASKIQSKFTVSEINRVKSGGKKEGADIPEIVKELLPEERELSFSPAQKGTIMHKVMQFISFHEILEAEEEEKALSIQIEHMMEKGLLEKEEKAVINETNILKFVRSDMGKRVVASAKVCKEQSFNLIKNADELFGKELKGLLEDDSGQVDFNAVSIGEREERVELMIQGTIDCFFEEEDGFVLLDYKTDHISRAEQASEEERRILFRQRAQQYETQIALYKEAIEASLEKPVKEAYLYFLSYGEMIPM